MGEVGGTSVAPSAGKCAMTTGAGGGTFVDIPAGQAFELAIELQPLRVPFELVSWIASNRHTYSGEDAPRVDSDGDGLLDRGGIPFQFQFLISSGSRFAERLGDILKEDLRKVGIAMEIRKVEWALFTQYLDQRNFDAVVLGWSLGLEQDPYQLWHSSQDARGSNIVGFSLPEADRLIEEGRMEFDRERRAGLYRHLHRIVHHEQPYTFLYTSPNLVALHRRFENVEVYPGGVDPLEWRVSKVYGDL